MKWLLTSLGLSHVLVGHCRQLRRSLDDDCFVEIAFWNATNAWPGPPRTPVKFNIGLLPAHIAYRSCFQLQHLSIACSTNVPINTGFPCFRKIKPSRSERFTLLLKSNVTSTYNSDARSETLTCQAFLALLCSSVPVIIRLCYVYLSNINRLDQLRSTSPYLACYSISQNWL